MGKVYVVMSDHGYTDVVIEGVFSTLKKARAFIKTRSMQSNYDIYIYNIDTPQPHYEADVT